MLIISRNPLGVGPEELCAALKMAFLSQLSEDTIDSRLTTRPKHAQNAVSIDLLGSDFQVVFFF